MARLSITKCQATGNDFVLVDNAAGVNYRYPKLAAMLCDRRFAVGADGLLVLTPSSDPRVDVVMRIFNADGTEAEMCGNGVRCVALYCREQRSGSPRALAIQTAAGIVRTEISDQGQRVAVRVAMGVPGGVAVSEDAVRVGDVTAKTLADVSMGNPHRVAFVDEALGGIDLAAFAEAIESDRSFTDGVNVEIARCVNGGIEMRVRERGVGETHACGTGACAVAVAAVLSGRATTPVRVRMPGGDVRVDWAGPGEQAYLTGGADLVFRTDVEIPDAWCAQAV